MKKLLITIVLLSYSLSFAQFKLDNWVSYSSRVKINGIATNNNNNLWFATDGGIFSKNIDNDTENIFTNVESLISNQISSIYYDSTSRRVYAGSNDGTLEIYENNKWTHISDIKNQKFSNAQINKIINYNNKIYIAGGFGLAIFDPQNLVFLESIFKIGSFSTNAVVNDFIIFDNTIWVATDEGIAYASLKDFISNPKSWKNFTTKEGLYQNKVYSIVNYDNKLFIMSERFILTYDGQTFEQFAESLEPFQSMVVINQELYYANIYKIFDKSKIELNINNSDLINKIYGDYHNNTPRILIAYENYGYGIYQNNEFKYYLPNSPVSNNIKDIKIDSDGKVWIASGFGASSKGFSSYDGQNWKNYITELIPQIKSNAYHRINIDANGRIIVSNYGMGLLIGNKSDSEYNFTIYNEENSEFRGLGTSPEFVVAGESALDKNGKIWVTNLGEISNGPSLICFDYDGTKYQSYGFQNPRIASQRTFMTIAIDPYGTKWVGGNNPTGTGLMYFNEMGTLDNYNDDVAGVITSSNNPNLLDNIHNTIAVDKNGLVWIGTPKGVVIINNPSQVLNGNISNLNIRNLSRLIGNVNVNDIMIDALNNKWIATSNGVWVLDPLATDTIAFITMDNSPLPTNEVISLATNPNTGKIYFGTNLGLYQANSLSVEPLPKYDIRCYPQPFNPIRDIELNIDGMSDFSEIRILTTSGELIRSINTASRKTVWDGKDYNGNYVKSGVYIISVKSSIGDNAGVQKIAIVNN